LFSLIVLNSKPKLYLILFPVGVVSVFVLLWLQWENAGLLTNALDMNKFYAPLSNKIQCCKWVEWKCTHHFFHIDLVHMCLL
jgi:hypothetical protein